MGNKSEEGIILMIANINVKYMYLSILKLRVNFANDRIS